MRNALRPVIKKIFSFLRYGRSIIATINGLLIKIDKSQFTEEHLIYLIF